MANGDGFSAGLKDASNLSGLIQAGAKIAEQREAFNQKRQTFEDQKNQLLFKDIGELSTLTGTARKAKLKQFQGRLQTFGKDPMDPVLEGFVLDEKESQDLLQKLARAATDIDLAPGQRSQFIAETIGGLGSPDALKNLKALIPILSGQAAIRAAGAKSQAAEEKGLRDLGKTFEQDKTVDNETTKLGAAQDVLKFLKSGNPVITESIKTLIAKMMEGSNRLSDNDIQRVSGSKAAFDQIAQFVSTLTTGQFVGKNREGFIKLAKGISVIAKDRILGRADFIAQREVDIGAASGRTVSKATILKIINADQTIKILLTKKRKVKRTPTRTEFDTIRKFQPQLKNATDEEVTKFSTDERFRNQVISGEVVIGGEQ